MINRGSFQHPINTKMFGPLMDFWTRGSVLICVEIIRSKSSAGRLNWAERLSVIFCVCDLTPVEDVVVFRMCSM